MPRFSPTKLAVAVALGCVVVHVAVKQALVARAQHEVAAVRARRHALLDRAAAYRRFTSEQTTACEQWLAEAHTRLAPPDREGTHVAPTAALAQAASAQPGIFGPYVCASPADIPAALWELVPARDDGPDVAERFAQAEAMLADFETTRRPPARPAVLIERRCSSEPSMYAHCVVFWWRPESGAVVASLRSSVFVGDSFFSPVNVDRELESEVRFTNPR